MRKRTIFIELTSLLDVILIMIFVLLTQARTRTAEALDSAAADQKKAAVLQESLQEALGREQELLVRTESLRAEAEDLKNRLGVRNLVLENSLILTVRAEADSGIRLQKGEAEQTGISYDWADETYAFNRLRSLLMSCLDETEGRAVFIVFQYDRSTIYRTEYEMIIRVIQELKLEAKNAEIPLSFIEMDLKE